MGKSRNKKLRNLTRGIVMSKAPWVDYRPEIKVLYTTGYAEDVFSHSDKLALDQNLLSKPYRRAELLRKVETLLGISSCRPSNRIMI